jgi:hypothetical protein
MSKKTLILVCDIDGVLYEWEPTARFLLEAYHDIVLEESDSWNAIQERISAEDWNWLWTEGIRYGLFRTGNVYKGGVEALRTFKTLGLRIILATMRPREAVRDTLLWVALHDIPLDGLVFCDWTTAPKWSVAGDVYIEDSPEQLYHLSRNRPDSLVVVMDRPWNADIELRPNMRRSGSWPETVDLIKEVYAHEIAHHAGSRHLAGRVSPHRSSLGQGRTATGREARTTRAYRSS